MQVRSRRVERHAPSLADGAACVSRAPEMVRRHVAMILAPVRRVHEDEQTTDLTSRWVPAKTSLLSPLRYSTMEASNRNHSLQWVYHRHG